MVNNNRLLIVIPILHGLENAYLLEDKSIELLTYAEEIQFPQRILHKIAIKTLNKLSLTQLSSRVQYSCGNLSETILKRLRQKEFDAIIIFKGVGLRDKDLKLIKQHVNKMYLFLWDPIDRYPFIMNTIAAYDQVYSCQMSDQSYGKIEFEPVHFCHVEPEPFESSYDAVFVGKFTASRLQFINDLRNKDMRIFAKLIRRGEIAIPRSQWLGIVESSKIVLDLGEADQSQWTARLADGLCMGKVVVTTSTETYILPSILRARVFTLGEFLSEGHKILNLASKVSDIEAVKEAALSYFCAKRFIKGLT